LDRADRIVVAGDDVVDLIRVAVRVGDRHQRDPQFARLGDGDVLFAGVDHIDRPGEPLHVRHAAEESFQTLVFLLELGDRLLAASEAAVIAGGSQAVETVDLAAHDREVRQHATHPAVVHKRHA